MITFMILATIYALIHYFVLRIDREQLAPLGIFLPYSH